MLIWNSSATFIYLFYSVVVTYIPLIKFWPIFWHINLAIAVVGDKSINVGIGKKVYFRKILQCYQKPFSFKSFVSLVFINMLLYELCNYI